MENKAFEAWAANECISLDTKMTAFGTRYECPQTERLEEAFNAGTAQSSEDLAKAQARIVELEKLVPRWITRREWLLGSCDAIAVFGEYCLIASSETPPLPQPPKGEGKAPRFENVSCSNCGQNFGPGDNGFSHCENHAHLRSRGM